jgi:hypothetical protein
MADGNKNTPYERLQYNLIPRTTGQFPVRSEKPIKSNTELQTAFLQKQYSNIVNNTYYTQVAIEADRRAALLDFQSMEWYPTIASALNLVAREMCNINENGSVLSIKSDSRQIKEELEFLFHKRLNVNTSLYYWSREALKNGDCFLLLLLDGDRGIVNVKALNKMMERKESIDKDNGEYVVEFKDLMNSQVYQLMQVAHFRMLGDMERLPYGQSYLEKIRKTHKMLVVAEDAMMIKRLTRSTNRLMYKIDVGNLDDNDVEAYMDAIASRFKREANVNPVNGQVDYRMGLADVTQDYFIPVRNGQSNTAIDVVSATDNPDQIADIEYLRDNLLTGLEIPKPFLNFQESSGEGKSLAMLDVRFARLIQQFQQNIVLELNKIAQIHLFLRGYEDESDNFQILLNNPSLQNDILRTELLNSKMSVYSSAVTPDEATQIAPMSQLTAKRKILQMTDDEIMEDLKQQMFERAIGEEFRQRFNEIDASGVFDDLMKKFKKSDADIEKGKKEGEDGESGGSPTGGGADAGASENPFESRMVGRKMMKDMKLLKEQMNKLVKEIK